MKLTKYGHACVVLEDQGRKLIIDPGEFTPEFGEVDNVVAVVFTHVHEDHLSVDHLRSITSANPDVKIFTTHESAKKWANQHMTAVKAGDQYSAGPFALRFYGELHNAVHPDWPQAQNVGVLVNESFYYPGDSFTLPDREVGTLAVPVGSSWLRLGESMDLIRNINPKQFFRTHDRLLSEQGVATTEDWLNKASDKYGPKNIPLSPGQSIEI